MNAREKEEGGSLTDGTISLVRERGKARSSDRERKRGCTGCLFAWAGCWAYDATWGTKERSKERWVCG